MERILGRQDSESERTVVETAMAKKHARTLPNVLVFKGNVTVKWQPDE